MVVYDYRWHDNTLYKTNIPLVVNGVVKRWWVTYLTTNKTKIVGIYTYICICMNSAHTRVHIDIHMRIDKYVLKYYTICGL